MTIKTKLSYVLLAAIFSLALFLRLYRLNTDNPTLYADEMGHYFALNTLSEIGVGALQKITTIIFTSTWFLGLNPLGVRFSSAIFGSLIALVGFFFAKAVNKSMGGNLYLRVALVFSFLTAVLPWNIAISRLGHTHVPLVVFFTLLHLTIYINSSNWVGKLLSFVPFVVSAYFYPVLIIMSPLILILPVKELFASSTANKKYIAAFFAFFILIISLFLVKKYQVFDASKRGLDLAIWRDVNVTADTNLYRGLARLTKPSVFSFGVDPEAIASKVFFNYPTATVSKFTKTYLSFFSPDFLFLKGDNILRHSTGMVGNFFLVLMPFMVYGAFTFFNHKSSNQLSVARIKIIFVTWILASPLPAAITKDGESYLLRAITLMPFLTYFCALGIVNFYEVLKTSFAKIAYLLFVFGITIYSAFYYFYGYFHIYPALAANSFEYGFKELAQFQSKNNGKMLVIWEDKYPFSLFCFWQNLPYSVCKIENTNTRLEIGKSRVDLALPEVIFSLPNSVEDLELIINSYLPEYIAIPTKYKKNFLTLPSNYKIIETVKNPDLTTAFEIYEI